MDIKSIFKKIFKRSDKTITLLSVEKSHEAKSFLHWKILVAVFFVAVIVMFANSFLIYEEISKGEFFSIDKKPKNGPSQSVIDVFEKTIAIYSSKAESFEKASKGGLDLPDPSL